MTRNVDNRKDVLLLLLYSPGRSGQPNEPIIGRTRLVKMLFLFQKEAMPHFRRGTMIAEDCFYEFFPWDFGPFSREVYDDINFFTLRGFIAASDVQEETIPESAAEWEEWLSCSRADSSAESISDEYKEVSFQLTEKGQRFAADLFASLSSAQKKLLHEFKKRTVAVPLKALLRYVYQTYEDMTSKSTIKEQVLGSG